MSKLRLAHAVLPFALWIVAMVSTTSCSCVGIYINGECSTTDDCLTIENYTGEGSVCDHGFCVCPDNGQACCPDGGQDYCSQADYDCRPKAECLARFLASHGCEAKAQCVSDAECPGPPDARCGTGRCIDGLCHMEIWAYEPLEGQFPGDCKTNVCSPSGILLVLFDPSDVPFDANPCTFDACNQGEPYRMLWPDKTPCPGMESGICVNGRCQDCSFKLGASTCLAAFICDLDTCVPVSCSDGAFNGQETFTDCGGPECRPCELNRPCMQGSDCLSGVCEAGLCKEGTHSDGVKNLDESGVDCGYFDGLLHPCPSGQPCTSPLNCTSRVCFGGICQEESCTDAVQNGAELGVDCGIPCSPCPG